MSTLLLFPALASVQDDVVPETNGNLIPWNQHDPLEWGDFMGTPNATSPHDAETVTVLSSEWEGEPTEDGKVNVTSVSATASFNKTASWVKENKNTTELLKHEQGHFDLAEIHAREKQKDMEKLVGKIFDSEDDVNEEIHKICKKVQKKLDDWNEMYDKQTDHGKDEKKQQQWEEKIKKMLEK